MSNESQYQWIPGKGIDLNAVNRMRTQFRKPLEPMGEAWFMSEHRRMFHELMEQPIKETPIEILFKVLLEISSGISCFGHRQEWTEWFKYLLPDLILRSHELRFFTTLLVQPVVTTFISVYWTGILEEYPEFRTDVINSLSVCLMGADLWLEYENEDTNDSYPKAIFLTLSPSISKNLRLSWHIKKADENVSAIMFFCLKYLEPGEMAAWVQSCISIRDPYWKGAWMVWLLGAYDCLHEPIVMPSHIEHSNPEVSWEYSHVLDSNFESNDAEYLSLEGFNDNRYLLSKENVRVFRAAIKQLMTEELIIDWAELFSCDSLLLESTYSVPDLLFDKIHGADCSS